MKKYEAVGCLCEIKKHFENQLEYARADVEKKRPDFTEEQNESTARYYRKEIEKLEGWVAALEMAGNQFTR